MCESLNEWTSTIDELRLLFDAVLSGNDGPMYDRHVAELLCPQDQQMHTKHLGTSDSPEETESRDLQLLRLTIIHRLAGLCLGNTPRVSQEGKTYQTCTLTLLHTLVHQDELFVHLDAMLDSPCTLLSYHAARSSSAVASSLLYWDPPEYGWLWRCLHRLSENVSMTRLLPGIRATAELVRALGHGLPSLPHTDAVAFLATHLQSVWRPLFSSCFFPSAPSRSSSQEQTCKTCKLKPTISLSSASPVPTTSSSSSYSSSSSAASSGPATSIIRPPPSIIPRMVSSVLDTADNGSCDLRTESVGQVERFGGNEHPGTDATLPSLAFVDLFESFLYCDLSFISLSQVLLDPRFLWQIPTLPTPVRHKVLMLMKRFLLRHYQTSRREKNPFGFSSGSTKSPSNGQQGRVKGLACQEHNVSENLPEMPEEVRSQRCSDLRMHMRHDSDTSLQTNSITTLLSTDSFDGGNQMLKESERRKPFDIHEQYNQMQSDHKVSPRCGDGTDEHLRLSSAKVLLKSITMGWLQELPTGQRVCSFTGSIDGRANHAPVEPKDAFGDLGETRAVTLAGLSAAVTCAKKLDSSQMVWQSCLETRKFAVTRLLDDDASSFDCRPCSWLLRVFGDQDDDLVEALLAAIQLWQLGITCPIRTSCRAQRGGSCQGWNPYCHFLSLLQHVSFDPSVLLDFLLSIETRFLEYLVRFLKFLRNRQTASRHWAAGHYEYQHTVQTKACGCAGNLPPQQLSTTHLVEYDSSSGISGEEENSPVSFSQSGFERRACGMVGIDQSCIKDVKKDEDGCNSKNKNVKMSREENIDTKEGKRKHLERSKEGCVVEGMMESKSLNDHQVKLHHQMKIEKNKVTTRCNLRTFTRRRCSVTRRPWRSKVWWIHRKSDQRGISAFWRGMHKPGGVRTHGRASNRVMCRSTSRWLVLQQCLLDLAGRITRLQTANLFPYQPGPLLNLLGAACRRQRS
uniref:protein Lines homolog 1 isoform X2 n=1 Tax=Myxine glutinosa TaxID=7769 RepID=UPI00358E7D29